MRLVFDSKDIYYKDPFGAVAAGTAIAFRTAVKWDSGKGDAFPAGLSQVRFAVREDGNAEQWLDMEPEDFPESGKCREDCGSMSFRLTWRPPAPGLYFYRFAIGSFGAEIPQEAARTEKNAQIHDTVETAETAEYQLTVYSPDFQTPDWLAGGLMYQIFPDRFAKSDSYTPPAQNKRYRMHETWGELPDCGPDENGVVWNNDFFGGNLRGIQEKLPYLSDLGVTVIYLNPIFRAFSNHRYDTANYMEIDPMLGTEEDFASLCRAAAERGIRIILDGVFNHTGSHSIYFNKDGSFDSQGACQSRESPYYPWYTFQEYPGKYDSWWGIDTLPAVNEMEESYRDYIIRGEDSVIRHWMRLGSWGFRLDVADELPDMFIEEVRQTLKEENPRGALIGEVWEDASNKIAYGVRRRYFQGAQLDSVMNYPLKDWLIAFLSGNGDAGGGGPEAGDGALLQDRITTLLEHYPQMCARSLMNILGTHDTERILTVFRNREPSYEEARQKLFLALLAWAFLPGIPCIYYGDELGMEGGRDPMNRCCFEQDKMKTDIADFYRRLLRFRSGVDGLGRMTYVPGPSETGCFSFFRDGAGGSLYVFLNQGAEERRLTSRGKEVRRALDLVNCGHIAFEGKDTLVLGPHSGVAVYMVGEKI
ncbi:glycoside hydrolase family 13 protein [Bacilliculturomica massiliensis]|uniref:glycoside hydrolase family 13 protein n=1 Tax=Bacilliculturomica massiliensis TaxID=1917867 RepID=UPI00103268D1|nr:glycoside hydrolase family 13 protein [Bacilliculturomica massiliensis]